MQVASVMRTQPLGGPHYPSWGSGTAQWRGTFRRSRRTHYPSWGSGTWRGTLRRASDRRSHYPSWGSGTAFRHGCASTTHCSLPLMGIGNPRRTSRVWSSTFYAHYPSWGSGTSSVMGFVLSSSPSHYPSWGSGTQPRARSRQARQADLITLMGIGNSSRVPTRRLGPRSHYPSWGSGTRNSRSCA